MFTGPGRAARPIRPPGPLHGARGSAGAAGPRDYQSEADAVPDPAQSEPNAVPVPAQSEAAIGGLAMLGFHGAARTVPAPPGRGQKRAQDPGRTGALTGATSVVERITDSPR